MATVVRFSSALGLALAALGFAVSIAAAAPGNGNGNGNGNKAVPEISAQGVPAGIAFVLGGVAVVLGRRRASRMSAKQAH
jgi:hypothetical protein